MLLQAKEVDKTILSARFEFGKTADGSTDFDPFDSANRLTMCQIRNKQSDESFRVAKGATKQILELCENADSIRDDYSRSIDAFAERGELPIICAAVCNI